MNIEEIDNKIEALEAQKVQYRKDQLNKMNWYERLSFNHSTREEQNKTYSMFKRGFKGYLQNFYKLNLFKASNNHFYISGFFELENKENGNKQTYYFSIEDLRGGQTFMIRTVKDFKDYTGGTNHYLSLDDFERLKTDLDRFVRFSLK
jgi:hypothetical protein|tara:strand:+ start:75 stop:518 length:444 start_codon:yes stop_codon:yes gene_type:complete